MLECVLVMTPDIQMDPSYLTRFGMRLRWLRVYRQLSQEELAERAGLDRTTIGQFERGHRSVSIVFLDPLAHALDLGEGHLLLPRAAGRHRLTL